MQRRFLTTKEFLCKSTTEHKKILELGIFLFIVLLIHSLSLEHCVPCSISNPYYCHWTPLHNLLNLHYTTCYLILCGAYYFYMVVVETIDQQIYYYYNILSTIGTEFHLNFFFWRFHDALRILDRALWVH